MSTVREILLVTKPLEFKDLVNKIAEEINSYWFNVAVIPQD